MSSGSIVKKNYLKEMSCSGYKFGNDNGFHRACLTYLASHLFPDKRSRIIDIGSGQGHCLFPLKEQGYTNLYALDIDEFNKNLFSEKEIDFAKVDVENQHIPYEDSYFDVVLSFHLIEHLKDPANFLNETYRILSNHGIFILVTPNWRKQYRTFWRDHTHIHPYDKESIARILRCFSFNPLSIKSLGVLKGIGRTGLWKVIKPLMFTGLDIIVTSKKGAMQD
jgi:2-polyprenyl-3-methyl-5-hydroxy-6-metoxy-1,4-benzoquinol methylase